MHFMAKLPVLSVLLLLSAFFAAESQAMTVEQAYREIPHNRTVFDATTSALSAAQIKALKRLFELSDRGVVLRVAGLQALQSSSNDVRLVLSQYDALTKELDSFAPPAEIESARALVAQAVRLHRQYFEIIGRDKEAGRAIELAYRQNQLVKQASQQLISAYSVLMQTFPKEPAVNRQAFYDYLCALDFL
jgi:hypothetical protein